MNWVKRRRLIGPLAFGLTFVALVSGCAPAYHGYSGCGVHCQYCPPTPLPYPAYSGRACHSCSISRHLATSRPAAQDAAGETR